MSGISPSEIVGAMIDYTARTATDEALDQLSGVVSADMVEASRPRLYALMLGLAEQQCRHTYEAQVRQHHEALN